MISTNHKYPEDLFICEEIVNNNSNNIRKVALKELIYDNVSDFSHKLNVLNQKMVETHENLLKLHYFNTH